MTPVAGPLGWSPGCPGHRLCRLLTLVRELAVSSWSVPVPHLPTAAVVTSYSDRKCSPGKPPPPLSSRRPQSCLRAKPSWALRGFWFPWQQMSHKDLVAFVSIVLSVTAVSQHNALTWCLIKACPRAKTICAYPGLETPLKPLMIFILASAWPF